MFGFKDLGLDPSQLTEAMRLACDWLVDIAQVKTEKLTIEEDSKHHQHKNWRGAIRGEYSVARGKWDFFCPIWHTGQAVKALTLAHKILKDDRLLEAAKLGADFIVNESIRDKSDPDYGLILGYEDYGDGVNTSAIMECLDGLIHLGETTGKEELWNVVIDALNWIANKAYMGKGLFRDMYMPRERTFKIPSWTGSAGGRPLNDDGVFLKGYYKTGDERFRQIFFQVANRLLRDEYPPGNWIRYPPCDPERGLIHPRHAYWWGYPMIMAYEETKDDKYLQCAIRSADWYAHAQRKDGGMFRGTFIDFNTNSFGHATSGIACATIMWIELTRILNDKRYVEPMEKALKYCMMMQFRNPRDPNLKGAILEKVLEPDGTDSSPYYIRDLGTIFFIQAAAKAIMSLSD
jgi:rhamnogalacturonyl hydrolase YesR